MSVWWILLIALCVALLFVVILTATVLFFPVIFIVDSRAREIRVRWLGLINLLIALPGAAGPSQISIAGRSVRFRSRAPKKEREKAEVSAPKERRRAFIWRCLRNSRIRRAIGRQVAAMLRRVPRSFELVRCRSNLSLTDPALNGMLAGALAQSRWSRAFGLRVNFTGENTLLCEVRFYPHRVFKAFAFLAVGLPYWAVFREWRASAR